MREIKFRGKATTDVIAEGFINIAKGDWVYGVYVHNDGKPYIISHDVADACEEYFAPVFWVRVDPETVGQLVHKKGKEEFYTGDICHAPDYECNFEIVYEDFCYWANTKDGGLETLEEYIDGAFVIGNRFDNPELLKEGA